jgi:hypothetical protein
MMTEIQCAKECQNLSFTWNKVLYFPAHKTYRDFFIRYFRKKKKKINVF